MNLEDLTMILGITVNLGWSAFGMICGLRWWQERKTRHEINKKIHDAIIDIQHSHHNHIMAAAWDEGYQDGKYDQIMEPMIEAGMSTPTTNPHKQDIQ